MATQQEEKSPKADRRIRDPLIYTLRSPIEIQLESYNIYIENLTQIFADPVYALLYSVNPYEFCSIDLEGLVISPSFSIPSGFHTPSTPVTEFPEL